MTLTIEDIAQVLRSNDFSYADERDLHTGIAVALARAGAMSIQREVTIAGGRIDFVVDGVGIEVKIKGSKAQVRRQLDRYAKGGDVDALLLVTTRSMHTQLASRTEFAVPVGVCVVGGL